MRIDAYSLGGVKKVDKKDWQKLVALGKEAKELEEQLKNIEAIVCHITPKYGERIANASTAATCDDKYIKYIEAKESIYNHSENIMADYMELVANANRKIDMLSSVDKRRIMRSRYIGGQTWQKVAEQIGYSERWCIMLHNLALHDLNKTVHSSSV